MKPLEIILSASLDSTTLKSDSNQILKTRDISDKIYEWVGPEEQGVGPDFSCAKGTIFLSSLSNQPGQNASQNFAKEKAIQKGDKGEDQTRLKCEQQKIFVRFRFYANTLFGGNFQVGSVCHNLARISVETRNVSLSDGCEVRSLPTVCKGSIY